jgi:DNA-binding transcriptional LysR family regulator
LDGIRIDTVSALPSLRLLQCFVAVAEELHFRRAAQRLHMTQPPLTQRIQAMERDLGVELFRRIGHSLQLTGAGRLLLKEARATLRQAERLRDVVHQAERGEAGRLRLGVTSSVPFLPSFTRAITSFQRDYPGVAVDLALVNSSQALQALRQRTLDIGLIRSLSAPLPPEWQQTTIARDRLMLVIPSGHPLAESERVPLRAIADENFLLFPRDHATALYGQIMDIWTRAGVIPRVTQEAEKGPAILALVAAGIGNAMLPSTLGAMKIDSVAWKQIDIEERWTMSSIVMVHRKEAQDERVQAHFIEYVFRFSRNGTD